MRVLLVRAGALGDVLLLRPALAALRRADHRVDLLAPAPADLLARAEVDALLRWDDPELSRMLAGETPAGPLGAGLRSADLVVAYTRAPSLVEALRSRARRLLVQDPSPPAAGPHAARWLAAAIAGLPGVPAAPPPPDRLRFSVADHDAVAALRAQLPERFLALHPGSGSPAKNWPGERFLALAAALSADRRFLVALGPAEDDGPYRGLPGAVVARELPLRQLGALLSRAGVLVGNDSGISHLAAAAGVPTVALFGPTDPSLWSPVGPSVRCLRAPDQRLETLAVDQVSRAVAALVAQVSGERTSTRLISR